MRPKQPVQNDHFRETMRIKHGDSFRLREKRGGGSQTIPFGSRDKTINTAEKKEEKEEREQKKARLE